MPRAASYVMSEKRLTTPISTTNTNADLARFGVAFAVSFSEVSSSTLTSTNWTVRGYQLSM